MRGQVDVGPGCSSSNLDSVAQGGGGGESPARSTVNWNVLVSLVGEEVGSGNIAPEEVFRQFLKRGDLKRSLNIRLEVVVVDVGSVHGHVKTCRCDKDQGDDRNYFNHKNIDEWHWRCINISFK